MLSISAGTASRKQKQSKKGKTKTLTLSPSKAKAQFLRHYDFCLKNVLDWSRGDPLRFTTLRASGLPFCALDHFYGLAMHGMARYLNLEGLFYTSVGTAVHTAMQRALALEGFRLFGHWKHRKTKELVKFSTIPDDSGAWDYEEVTIKRYGIVGHVDTIFILADSEAFLKKVVKACKASTWQKRVENLIDLGVEFAVIDYKTCSLNNKAAKVKSPGSAYVEQVDVYALCLRRQYGLNIVEIGNAFIPRDNPRTPGVTMRPVTKELLRNTKAKLKVYCEAHKAIQAAKTWKDIKDVVGDFGFCSAEYCEVCKNPRPLALMKMAFERAKENKRLPLRKMLKRELAK